MRKVHFVNVLIIVVLALAFMPAAGPVAAEGPAAAKFVPGQVLVGFPEGLSAEEYAAQASALAGEVSAQVVRQNRNLAVLQFAEDADVLALAAELSERGVIAEPNYIFSLPEPLVNHSKVMPEKVRIPDVDKKYAEVSVSTLAKMKTRTGKKTINTYPNDGNYWANEAAWWQVGAPLVWNNTTPQVNVCVIDTGVDYTHPDLSGRIIKGYDFINGDADPMDDHAHGTHVAGIITAKANNKLGMGGISSTRVVAVKALDSSGSGTAYDVNSAIYYCADRADVKVISMSLGGPYSANEQNAVDYAVNARGKLLVAAAGNDATSSTTNAYPAAFSTTFPGKVVAVAASGDPDGDYSCQSEYTNYGSWTTIIAPGTDIYSTTPWDKPFWTNYMYGVYNRYDYFSGTSMATPVVAAVAARAWGYLPVRNPPTPSPTNVDVFNYITDAAHTTAIDPDCWDASMANKRQVNVAMVLERGGLRFRANDAMNWLPLDGATVTVYRNGVAFASAKIVPDVWVYWDGWKDIYYNNTIEFVNLPAGDYTAKVSKAGYSGPSNAFIYSDFVDHAVISPGWYGYIHTGGRGLVPKRSGDFVFVAGSWPLFFETGMWLPFPAAHPDAMVVSWDDDMGYVSASHPELEGDSTGSLFAYPFARVMYHDGYNETIVVKSRPGAPNNIYYPGTYTFAMHIGGNFNQDATAFFWKNGVLLARIDNQCVGTGPYWRIADIQNNVITVFPSNCGSFSILPW